jgi:uncharacterized protein YciI
MKRLVPVVFALGLAASAPAQTPPASPSAPRGSDWKPGEAPPEMMTYYMIMLVKGPKWTPETSPALEQLQKDHLDHLRSLWAAGKMVVAGPLTDGGTIRGLCVYKVGSIEEARALASDDPAVKAGRLAVEAHPWMVQKGILP